MAVIFGHDLPQVSLAAMATRVSVTPTSVMIFVALLVFFRSVYYRYFHPLSKVPGMESPCRESDEKNHIELPTGPFLASITRLWYGLTDSVAKLI